MKNQANQEARRGFDLIGDIHGRADDLRRLLLHLGYREADGSFRHPDRVAVFVGDFVDRGPDVAGVLRLVKPMVDRGAALAVIGNHEYNLLSWFQPRPGKPGKWLRSRSEGHRRQIESSLPFIEANPDEWAMYREWFLDLPLSLDLGALRVVHACWDHGALALLGVGASLRDCGFGGFERRDNPVGDAVAMLLMGPEMELPDGLSYPDSSGGLRKDFRARWWAKHPGIRYPELAMPGPKGLPEREAPADLVARLPGYDPGEPPVFFGHYGFKSFPGLMASNLACVDYLDDGGPIGAYRYEAGEELVESRFVRLPAKSGDAP